MGRVPHSGGVGWISYGLLAAVASLLILPNLGDHLLWQDEAQTALVAKTVVQTGLPRISDGLNNFSQELGAEAGPDGLWKWHSWLPFYAVAASFKVWGYTTWAARLPFALAGI